MTRTQVEMLGDFVDFHVRFDADFLPHPGDRLDHFKIFCLEAACRLHRELHGFGGRIARLRQ